MDLKSINEYLRASGEALKRFDWHSLKKIASPQASDDLNVFLEKLPQNAGQTMLAIAATVWAFAGATGLYVTVQLNQITDLRIELAEADALKPIVPHLQDVAVNPVEIKAFIEKTEETYKGLTFKAQGASVVVTAGSLSSFGEFREAIGHVQNGGDGWRVSIDRLCVGRECEKEPLAAVLKINKVSVRAPG